MQWVVVPKVVVVVLLLLVRYSAATMGWWWCVLCGVVASVDDWCCDVVGGVCIVVCCVVMMYMGWSGSSGTGGGVLDVDIWAGVCFGNGDVVCGGCSVYVVVSEVRCGCGGGVVVFGLHSLLPSVSPAQLVLSIFPALSCFPSSTPSLWGL